MTQLLVVTGPTASGKTAVGIALARRLGTEIISADSMQFYKGMEIGTVAPTEEDLAAVRHHFVSFLAPCEHFSAGEFQKVARHVVEGLNERGKTAVAVGGSGLYVRALVDGLFPGPGRDAEIRASLAEKADTEGVPALYERLKTVDWEYAAAINSNDLRRIVRALEVYELTGRPLSALHREHRERTKPLDAIQVAFDYPREVLYERINARVDKLLQQGLLEEVRLLLEKGYGGHIERLRSLGYREMASYLRGECSLDEATQLMKQNTRRFAKRQLSWFRGDRRIHWFPVDTQTPPEEHTEAILALLA